MWDHSPSRARLSDRDVLRELERLQYEAEEYRRREDQRIEEAQREREERRREREELYQERMRTADDWPDALRKQIRLMGEEVHWEEEDPENGTYFTDTVAACKRALEIWPVVAASYEDRVAILRRQIDELQNAIRLDVARQVETEQPDNSAWRLTAAAIRTENPSEWLDW